jgi:YebC/PmpR family DNA-binding regulatory protein
MSGHSKWANIQHRKGAQDAKRGQLFTKFIREITVASRLGGGDASSNPRLRTAVDKALAGNMPKNTVERAIKRGTSPLEGENYEEVRYEGYGPNGVAVIVDCMTDNRNRTVSTVRYAFSRCGGNLGTGGSVAFLFKEVGQLSYDKESDEEKIMELALESGAEDVVQNEDNSIDVLTTPENFFVVKEYMEKNKLPPLSAEITWRAETNIPLELEDAKKMIRLLDMLEELDDVQHVYSNADIADGILAQL